MRCKGFVRTALCFVLVVGCARIAAAAVRLPSVIGDNMVLQRGQPAPIWGWADKGEQVTVAIAGQTIASKAGDDGRWKAVLAKLERRTAVGNDRQRFLRQRHQAEKHPRRRGVGLLRPVEHGNGRRRMQGRASGKSPPPISRRSACSRQHAQEPLNPLTT